MARRLDDRFARAAAAPTDGKPYRLDWDDQIRGFGLRTTKGVAKSWILNYRSRGIERRLTIGSWPAWNARQAREEASRLRRLVDQGEDPQADKHAARTAPTVCDLAARYQLEVMPRKRPRSQREDRSMLRMWIEPHLGARKVIDLRHSDVGVLHRKITAAAPVRANRCLSLLSRMLSLAVRWEWIDRNPAIGIERNPEHGRQRYLSPVELARLVEVLRDWPDQRVADVVRLLLLTGARRSEVTGARWEQIDLAAGTWSKPSSVTKQDRLHNIPLSAPARQLLTAMQANSETVSNFVFPAKTQSGHLEDLKQWPKIRAAAELSDFRLHDLRHSYASFGASSGLSLPILGALLGHSMASTTARYAHLLLDPLRQATDRIGAVVTGGEGAEIVKLPRR